MVKGYILTLKKLEEEAWLKMVGGWVLGEAEQMPGGVRLQVEGSSFRLLCKVYDEVCPGFQARLSQHKGFEPST